MLKALADRVFSSVRESLMLAGAFLTGRPDTSGSNSATWRHDFFLIRAIESSVHDFSADAITALRSYFIEEISQRCTSPGDDLISVLASAQDETDTFEIGRTARSRPAVAVRRRHDYQSDRQRFARIEQPP
jgi:hypothetical protein